MKKHHVKTLLIAVLLLFAFAFCGLLVYRSIHIGYVSRWEKERDAVLPGIVCIGDSLTEGADSDFPPYPKMLETMLTEQICSLPVINLGHGGEDSATILAQAGALELKLHSFTLPEDKTKAKEDLSDMEAGRTPSSLRQDGIHYNEAGTRAVAERVYEKLMEFPEFQELRRFSGSSPEWR